MTVVNSLSHLRQSLTEYFHDFYNSETYRYKKSDRRYYYKQYSIDLNLISITQIKIRDVHQADYALNFKYHQDSGGSFTVNLNLEGNFSLIRSYNDSISQYSIFFGILSKFLLEKLEGFNSIYFEGLKSISREIINHKIAAAKREFEQRQKENTSYTPPDSTSGGLIIIEETVNGIQKLHRRVGKDNYLSVQKNIFFLPIFPETFKFQEIKKSLKEILSRLDYELNQRFDGGEDSSYENKYFNYFLTHKINNGIIKYSKNEIDNDQFLKIFEKIVDECRELQNPESFGVDSWSYRDDYLAKRKELMKFLLLIIYIAKHNLTIQLNIPNDFVLIDLENFNYCNEKDYFSFFKKTNLLYQKNRQLIENFNIEFNEDNLTYCVLTEDERTYINIYYLSRSFEFFVVEG